MRKIFIIRLVLIGFIALMSFFLFNGTRNSNDVGEVGIEEVSTGSPGASGGEFLIWESVTRYMMASYN